MTTADQQPPVLTDGVAADALDRAVAGPSTWSLDAAHSSAAFRHKTMWGLVTVRGTFSDLAGRAEILPDGSARGRVDIGAASLNTKNAKRDTHLKSADFFDAQAHPRIVVDVRRATRSGGTVNVSGDLTAAGITRPLDFTATGAGSHRRRGHPPRGGRGGPGELRYDLESDGHAERPRHRVRRGPLHPVGAVASALIASP